MKLDISPIKDALKDIYESKYFPMYCVGGGVLLVGLTNDILWLGVGLVGFAWGLLKR